MESKERNGGKTLQLKIKSVYLQQILHGYKQSEYRERSDYYKNLLQERETVDRPADPKGWVRCLDGKWRQFKPWSVVRFTNAELGTAEYEIKSIDVSSSVYVIRLGNLISRTQLT